MNSLAVVRPNSSTFLPGTNSQTSLGFSDTDMVKLTSFQMIFAEDSSGSSAVFTLARLGSQVESYFAVIGSINGTSSMEYPIVSWNCSNHGIITVEIVEFNNSIDNKARFTSSPSMLGGLALRSNNC